MYNAATGSGWKWMLDNGTAYLQIGQENSEYYSLNIQDPAAAISSSKIAELLNVTEDMAVERLKGQYPAFLDHYNAGTNVTDINSQVMEEILKYISSCDVSVEENQAVKSNKAIDTIEISYTVPSDKMKELVKALKVIRNNSSKNYDAYVDNVFRQILFDAGCDIYATPETSDITDIRWDFAINDLEMYILDSDANFDFSFSISQETGNLVNLSVYSNDELDGENVIVQINLDLNDQHDKESTWLFGFRVSNKSQQKYDTNITITGQISNGSNYFSNSTIFEYNNQHEIWKDSKLIEYNKQDNSFSVYATRNNEELIVSGTVTAIGQEMRMSIQNVQHQNKEYTIDVSVSAHDKIDTSNAPTAKDIATLSENDLNAIQTKVINNMPASVFGSWESEEEFDLSVFETFLTDYDYDGDGDCGDSDDRIFFTVINQMLNAENAN